MSSVVIAGDTSGSVTLQAPAVSGTTVLTLPATSGTLLTTTGGVAPATAGNVLFTTNGTTWTSTPKLTSGTPVATTSGTSVTIGSIPSWVKRITVQLMGVSWTTGATQPLIQLGTAGGFVTTGYSSAAQLGNTNTQATNLGLLFASSDSGSAGRFWWGAGVLTLADAATNSWVWSATVAETLTTAGAAGWGSGGIALGGTLTQIKFYTLANAGVGTDTFDAGSINLLYE